MTIIKNALNPSLDISGTFNQSSDSNLSEEPLQLGEPLSGQNGSNLLITDITSGNVTVSGLFNMNSSSTTRLITISGADNPLNNGTFKIVEFISSTSIKYENALATLIETNNGNISWIERNYYTLEDDLNFIRTDRKNIKGTSNYYDQLPTYIQPSNINIDIPTNLNNISGKTLDAKVFIVDIKMSNVLITHNSSFIKITDMGNLKHSTPNDFTGIPLFDNDPYFLDYESCYVEIIDSNRESNVFTLFDPNKKIFGLTRDGASTSPDSVEIEFRCVDRNQHISNSISYTWEEGQPNIVDFYFGFANRADQITPAAFRATLIGGLVGNSNLSSINRIILETTGAVVYVGDGDIALKI